MCGGSYPGQYQPGNDPGLAGAPKGFTNYRPNTMVVGPDGMRNRVTGQPMPGIQNAGMNQPKPYMPDPNAAAQYSPGSDPMSRVKALGGMPPGMPQGDGIESFRMPKSGMPINVQGTGGSDLPMTSGLHPADWQTAAGDPRNGSAPGGGVFANQFGNKMGGDSMTPMTGGYDSPNNPNLQQADWRTPAGDPRNGSSPGSGVYGTNMFQPQGFGNKMGMDRTGGIGDFTSGLNQADWRSPAGDPRNGSGPGSGQMMTNQFSPPNKMGGDPMSQGGGYNGPGYPSMQGGMGIQNPGAYTGAPQNGSAPGSGQQMTDLFAQQKNDTLNNNTANAKPLWMQQRDAAAEPPPAMQPKTNFQFGPSSTPTYMYGPTAALFGGAGSGTNPNGNLQDMWNLNAKQWQRVPGWNGVK